MNSLIEPVKLPSNDKFGWFFFVVFLTISLYCYIEEYFTLSFIFAIISALIASITFFAPQFLTSLNQVWYSFGIILGKIINPFVLGAIFFILITPIALITRLFGRDELKMKKSFVQSYWIDRSPPGPQSDSFKNQF